MRGNPKQVTTVDNTETTTRDFWAGFFQQPIDWQNQAACADSGLYPDAWFPDEATYDDTQHAAVAICERCPVARECLDYALAINDYTPSIWGGVNGERRRRINEGRLDIEAIRAVCTWDDCGREYFPVNLQQKYCSDSCKKNARSAYEKANRAKISAKQRERRERDRMWRLKLGA